jgi:hypothetical protein
MRRGALVVATGAALALAGPASAAAPPTGWNGENPFQCELQQAGFGETGPNPAADPYCVEFDKRRQNVTQLGVVDFLAKEPGRVAAASAKCFYFQSDHWRGSVVQDNGATKTYEWDGHYFFDKARGEGGVWVTNFNFNGQTGDPNQLPGMPPEYGRYFGPGTGGLITHNEVPSDPRCVEQARTSPPYRTPGPGARGCLVAKGRLTSSEIAGLRLGDSESRVRSLLGDPNLVRRGFLRWCFQDGSSIRAGQESDRSGMFGSGDSDPTAMLLTTSSAFRARGVGPGSSARTLRRRFRGAVRRFTVNGKVVWSLSRRSRMVAGVRSGRVAYLAVYDGGAIRRLRDLRAFLRRGG